MSRLIIFLIFSVPLILISWKTFFKIKSHGLYRFLAWECILWLLISNIPYWLVNALSIRQIISWIFLFLSLYLVIAAVLQLEKRGQSSMERKEVELYAFEKTTKLITQGIYRYIRHPMYSSLLFLTWGAFFKHTTLFLLIISLFSTLLLYITAKLEEHENMAYFGSAYTEYMKRTRMLIPFVF
jgi:protein-S-isoprenylcysteine O-methyltransferase Ste14